LHELPFRVEKWIVAAAVSVSKSIEKWPLFVKEYGMALLLPESSLEAFRGSAKTQP
jgi:hypothetical protein